VTSLKSRPDDATIEVLDAAYWMKGCSSLGRLRFAVLLRVGAGKKRDDEFCLIDIKEATACRGTACVPRDHAQGPCGPGGGGGQAPVSGPWGANDGEHDFESGQS
jgi:hypothetical protein